MSELDYKEIINVLREELYKIGAYEIADKNNYLIIESEEKRLPNEQELVIQMLEAFDRKLSLEDKNTYLKACEKINNSLSSNEEKVDVYESIRENFTFDDIPILDEYQKVKGVVVFDEFNERNFSFDELPDLKEIRRSITSLIENLSKKNEPTPPKSNYKNFRK